MKAAGLLCAWERIPAPVTCDGHWVRTVEIPEAMRAAALQSAMAFDAAGVVTG